MDCTDSGPTQGATAFSAPKSMSVLSRTALLLGCGHNASLLRNRLDTSGSKLTVDGLQDSKITGDLQWRGTVNLKNLEAGD